MGPLPAAPGCDCHVCRPEESYDDALDRGTIDTVLRHGWQVILVADDGPCDHADHAHDADEPDQFHDESDSGPAFAYTVGLGHRAGHPELLMSGLDPGVMHRALNDVAQRVLDGRRLRPGDVLEDVLAGVPVAIERVADPAIAETVLWSGWFHRRQPEALVVVWPDGDGIFPWQPGVADIVRELQPRDWRVPVEHTGGVAPDPAWCFPVPPEHKAFSCTHVVDEGAAVLWAARQPLDGNGEDWSVHCGADDHESDDIRLLHFAHLVRSAPSLRQLGDLGLDEEAWRDDTDSPWERAPIEY